MNAPHIQVALLVTRGKITLTYTSENGDATSLVFGPQEWIDFRSAFEAAPRLAHLATRMEKGEAYCYAWDAETQSYKATPE